jgi:hypothetical protein
MIICLILFSLTVIYWVQFTGLQDWLVPMIYAFCSTLSILCPIPVYVLLQIAKGRKIQKLYVNKKNTFSLFNGIIIAWAILFINTYLAKVTGFQLWSQLSVPVGSLIVGSIAWIIHTKQEQSRCIELYNSGKSISQICETLGMPKQTVKNIFAKNNI